jgi:histidinol-phosphate/aromatic aminotransferase/cobyric acid decarboxylase-like protein
MLDEAYIHFSDEPWGTGLVKAGEDVIILRTFSKIYGMAGLRAGYALGRPDLLDKMRSYSAGALPATAMAAAKASLLDRQVVPSRKRIIGELRADLVSFLRQHGYTTTASRSCKVMVDTKRPVEAVIDGMADEKVLIGRPWPVWPTHARISIGTAEEMEKFKLAFLKVTDRIPEKG